jgi:competence protein ComEC
VARWPQHHVAAALLLGLVAGTGALGPLALVLPVATAAAWATQRRPGWAVAAVAALLLGAMAGHAREAATWRAAIAPLATGAAVGPDEPVEVEEHLSQALDGGWRAAARVRGATVDLRLPVSAARPALGPGDLLAVRGRLRRADPRALGLRARGIAVVLDARPVRITGRRGGWRGAIDGVRRRAEATLDRAGGPERRALLRGVVLGQDEGFSTAQEDAYRRSGLAHLVAASGQNVALLAALVLGIGALIGVPRRPRIALAALTVAAYVPLAGAGPSIRRAGVMGLLTLASLALGRPADRWWALLLAGIATVLVDPLSPGQLGWQLSFAAVVGLLLLVDPLTAGLGRRGVPRWAALALAVPLSATLATAPVLAATVGDVSLTSLPANVLVEPVVAPLTWAGLLAAALGPTGEPLSGLLVAVTRPGLDWIDAVARWAARPGWAVTRPPPVVALLPAAALALVILLATRPGRVPGAAIVRRRPGVARALAVALALVAALGGGVLASRRPGGEAVGRGIVVLDVGQGSATLLRDGSHAILVDAGPAGGRVLDRLAAQGVRRLDALVLSHAAADHSGGAPAVAARLRPRVLVDGRDGRADPAAATAAALVRADGGRVVAGRAGLRLRAGAIDAVLRWPPATGPGPSPGADPNERAVVVRATVGGLAALLPSDLEGPALRRVAGGPVDLLALPHHGSADPDVPRLLAALRPALAVASVGRDNGYGHPAPPTVAAVRAAGVPLRRTDREGDVVLPAPP